MKLTIDSIRTTFLNGWQESGLTFGLRSVFLLSQKNRRTTKSQAKLNLIGNYVLQIYCSTGHNF